jgi:hypothetical protein
MLKLSIDNIGDLAIVECEGRIVQTSGRRSPGSESVRRRRPGIRLPPFLTQSGPVVGMAELLNPSSATLRCLQAFRFIWPAAANGAQAIA